MTLGLGWIQRLRAVPLVDLFTLSLLLLLTWQLVVTRRTNATLLGEIDRGTRAFVVGDSIPSLPVRLPDGRPLDPPSLCDGTRPLLLIISSPQCSPCRLLQPEWSRLAFRSDLTVLVVETGPGAGAGGSRANLLQGTAPGSTIVDALRIREVPAVLLSGPDCRIRAAGTGLAASRSVLRLAGARSPAPAVLSTSQP